MIQRLLDSGLPPKEIVWTHILPSASSMVANQAQLFIQCLDFYLKPENAHHLADIQRLSKEDTPESDEIVIGTLTDVTSSFHVDSDPPRRNASSPLVPCPQRLLSA